MKKVLLILVAVLTMIAYGCTSEKGAQQLETAAFEEKQNNREHAIKLYEEIISKYPGSPNAKTAQDRLAALKGRQ
jgi:outer membrane protein assembly factor BamD (BamD/ComL family)